MSDYPGGIDSFTAKTDEVDEVMAVDVNELQAAIVATQTELGTDPAGTATDVKTRLANVISDGGFLKFKTSTELTISSGAITKTQNFHTVDTESDAATDNLDTISGGAAGDWIILRVVTAARVVTIRHAQDNIVCATGSNIVLSATSDLAIGIYDGGLSKWILGNLALGSTVTDTFTINQNSATGAKVALTLDQDDVDFAFLDYVGTSAADQTKSISTVNGDGSVEGPKNFSAAAGWAFAGMIRIRVNGTDGWVPYYTADTA